MNMDDAEEVDDWWRRKKTYDVNIKMLAKNFKDVI